MNNVNNPNRPFRPAIKPVKSARRVAYDILRSVTSSGAYAALSLDKHLSGSNLAGADRRLATALVYDTLENMIKLDYVLSLHLKKKGTDPAILDLLRIGACQILLYERIPDSAAVNETVTLCDQVGLSEYKPVVNGVLRNIVRERDLITWPDPEAQPAAFLSILYSIPDWLAEKLIHQYGYDDALKIVSHRERGTGVTIRPNMTRFTGDQFEKYLNQKHWSWKKLSVPNAYEILGAVQIGADPDHVKGFFSIQGTGSILAAMAVDVKNGWQVIDCCAAPGGKTGFLAESMKGTGRIFAWDVHPHRVELIQQTKKRLGMDNIRPAVRDAEKYWENLSLSMDAVLIDAPCSGFGVMLSKPDVKYRHTSDGITELTKVQARLLEMCSRYVKKGGTLVYSTCTFLKEENEEQIKAFLSAHPEFCVVKLPDSIPDSYKIHANEYGIQLFSYRDGVEGFFISRLKRV